MGATNVFNELEDSSSTISINSSPKIKIIPDIKEEIQVDNTNQIVFDKVIEKFKFTVVAETPITEISQKKNDVPSTHLLVFDRIIENFKLIIEIPEKHWLSAEHIAHNFNLDFQNTFVSNNENVERRNTLNGLWIYINFMKYIIQYKSNNNENILNLRDINNLLIYLFKDFSSRYLKGNEIHMRTRGLTNEFRVKLIQYYYDIFGYLQKNEETARAIEDFLPDEPAIAKAVHSGDAQVLAVFGGQGYPGFKEIREAYNIYKAIITDYIITISNILKDLSLTPDFQHYYPEGLDIMKWLNQPESLPDDIYLDSAPVSFPLIGVAQLINYLIFFRTFRKTPDWARHLFVGSTGHSQGLISSVVISSSGTEEEYFENSKKAVTLLLLIGVRSQQVFPNIPLNLELLHEVVDNGDENDKPTCMLSINGLSEKRIIPVVNKLNKYVEDPDRKICISLINGRRMFVVTGDPKLLYALKMNLKEIQANPNESQARIPYSRRKPSFTMKFLSATIPAHNMILKTAVDLILADVNSMNITFPTRNLAISIYRNDNGMDMKEGNKADDLIESLVKQICILPVDWIRATYVPELTHILDFGPGGVSGVGSFIDKSNEGTGVQIILASTIKSSNANLKCKMFAYTTELKDLPYGINWAKEFTPKLIRNADGNILMDTRYTRLTGHPPLLVGGMTPTTSNPEFVSAIVNAGYNVEIACGGLYSPEVLEKCIQEVSEKIPDGEGILCNVIFLNQRLCSFQIPNLVDMRRYRNIRIEGITIAAGVPSLDYCRENLPKFIEAGIPYVGFKPGNRDAILRCIEIARAFPELSFVIEWTGGRGGGHHSYEDFYVPILETYGDLRKQSNIVIIVGSGFGDDVETLPFMTGDWSVEFGYPPMPFDGILIGSRVCVAKEALTSESVKNIIVNTPGVEDQSLWEKSFDKPVGGVVTVESEFGEPIHNIATRGVMFWKEMDQTIFSIKDPKKRLEKLLERKDYIIERLNKDFSKVWFGKKMDKPCDLEEMTYSEVILRLIELLFLQKRKEWIDISYAKDVADFVNRTEERFAKDDDKKEAFLQSYESLLVEDPVALMEEFFDTCAPGARTELLTTEDIEFFIGIVSIKDRKPVPFIPVLNEEFQVWLKRDSLWPTEDIEAVIDQDPQRIPILQGPVAVHHSKIANQPVKEILDGIVKSHIKSIKTRYYANRLIPNVEYLGGTPIPSHVTDVPSNVNVEMDGSTMIYTLPNEKNKKLPEDKEWIEFIAGPEYGWLRALLTTTTIARNKTVVSNIFKKLFKPHHGQYVKIYHNIKGKIEKLELYGLCNIIEKPAIEILIDKKRNITVDIREIGAADMVNGVTMTLLYRYTPEQGSTPICEIMEGRNSRISEYYYKTWFGSLPKGGYGSSKTVYKGDKLITEEDVKAYSEATGYVHPSSKIVPNVDYINVISLHSAFQALFVDDLDLDIHLSFHLTMDYEIINPVQLKVGQMVHTDSIVNSVTIIPSGTVIEFISNVYVDQVEYVKVTSTFLYRGKYNNFDKMYSNHEEPDYIIKVTDNNVLDVLKTRKYLKFTEKINVGDELLFKLKTKKYYSGFDAVCQMITKGKIYNAYKHTLKEVGEVIYDSAKDEILEGKNEVLGNPVTDFVKKIGQRDDRVIFFDNDGYNLLPRGISLIQNVPSSNMKYSLASKDTNPIHTNIYFAILAGIDSPITQGMWTYVTTRHQVEMYAANNDPNRMVKYKTKFINPVHPNDKLKTSLRHIGMHNGNMVIKITVRNLTTDELVIKGEAEIKQKPTAYVFTGQGAQSVGMGQDLYQKSEVAKAVWDNADAYLMKKYGFSILEIVRNNPKNLTVYFGGEDGEEIKKNYMSMTCIVPDANGNLQVKPIFPEIDENTYYYEFKSPTGLLNSTQFTQPAINLYEKAAYDDMYEKGYISDDAVFAGHSLGEFSALSCVGKTQSVESLVETTFYRGLVFQYSVERDEQNRSDFAMCAVNPSRVHPYFTFELFEEVVRMINEEHQGLLEIVNYNVENYQYVVTGDLTSLEALRNTLNKFSIKFKKFMALYKENTLKAMNLLKKEVSKNIKMAEERKEKEGFFKIERGKATIPLNGIDVPFHSRYLSWAVSSFRDILRQSVKVQDINPKFIIGRYIPNLMGEPFSIEKEYAIRVQKRTSSDYLQKIINEWDKHTEDIAYILLLELLSYQLASAVQWIKTQNFLFNSVKDGGFDVERVIEFGPSPTLVGMAKRTIAKKYSEIDKTLCKKRQLLAYNKDANEVYYQLEDIDEDYEISYSSEQAPSSSSASTPAAMPTSMLMPTPMSIPMTSSSQAASVADVPVSPNDIVRVILAQKLKKSINEIPMSKSIKELAGGRSTVQNEITGDLQAEFGVNAIPVKAEELPVEELGKQISGSFNGHLGKYTSQLVNRMISSKMPAGFSASSVNNYLSNNYGFGKGRIDSTLLVGITMEPSSRLGSENEAQSWLDSVVNAYSSISETSFNKGSSSLPVPTVMSMPMSIPMTSSSQAASVADVPVSPNDIVRVILAQKLKKSINEIPMSKSIKELAGGRSTVQNEITGDLQAEFGVNAIPVKAEELPVEELGKQISGSFNGHLGKYTSQLVNRMISSKMPAGFASSKIKDYIKSSYGLGEQRTESVLLYGTAMEPSVRLTSESEAQGWLDDVVSLYSNVNSLNINKGGSSGSIPISMPNVLTIGMGNSAEVAALESKENALILKQIETYAKYLGIDLHIDQKKLVAAVDETAKIQSKLDLCNDELGEEFTNGITPKFSYRKARIYESSWNWGYQDLWIFVYNILTGRQKNVDEMVASDTFHTLINRANKKLVQQAEFINTKVVADQKNEKIKSILERFTSILLEKLEDFHGVPHFKFTGPFNAPNVNIDESGNLSYVEVPREMIRNAVDYVNEMEKGAMRTVGKITKKVPYLYIRNKNDDGHGLDNIDMGMSKMYFDGLKEIVANGISLTGKHILITGCGRHSIGEKLLKYLLASGAKVVATTSSYNLRNIEHYRKLYEENGTKGSKLVIVPFNQGSKKDINDLIDFVYSKDSRVNGLGWDLDIVIPFAAISELGRDISDIDGKSELAHRIMLTNIIRILGAIRIHKMKGHSVVPSQVILPCSFNHGVFGGDGLYGESKMGLESLLNRWKSESWSKYLSIIGTCIGWTRGTNIMDQNSITARGIEEQCHCRTFSTSEMAFNILGLMTDSMISIARKRPLYADFNGGMQFVSDIMPILKTYRESIVQEALRKKMIVDADKAHRKVVVGITNENEEKRKKTVEPRSNISIDFPEIKDPESIKDLKYIGELLDLDRVVVVTGFGEVGPYGNSRTRWEMEAEGKLSLEGCVELAWIMGFIKHVSYMKMADGTLYSGWVDAKTGSPVKDIDIKASYEKEILAHTGIRLVEPDILKFDPNNKGFLQEIVVDEDFPPFEASKEEAESFRKKAGDFVEINESKDSRYMVRLLKGASIYVPKALQFDRIVSAQIPTGWDATRYGIPKEIVDQVDPVTCYCIVSFIEALVCSGITDPYEFYEYVHVSEIGNILGSGHGPSNSYSKIYRERFFENPINNDILQESFINTMGAWINLLLLSSSGPICAPVGACASGILSVDIGMEYILSGKAKVAITGGFDETNETGAYEFAQMKATANTLEDITKNGREPSEVSRPCTSSRNGFTEAHGAGVQVLMSASLALKMGVPIYAIIAHTAVASDKEGRSVPAPGQGILTSAREVSPNPKSPLLNPKYRARQLNARKRWIKSWVKEELNLMKEEVENMKGEDEDQDVIDEFIEERTKFINDEAYRQEKEAFQIWGQDFYKKNPTIAPLRGALAAFGLTIDDIGIVSLHGTGTKANDKNETKVFNQQFEFLGRTKGNVCPAVCQKSFVGHGKGAASSWMLNGIIQAIQTGIIPGNRNADNIDPIFEDYDYLLFNDKTIKTPGIKAGLLKAFGFGQVGGEILVIHPDCLFAAFDKDELEVYRKKRLIREQKSFRYLHNSLSGNEKFVQVKNEPPYTEEQETEVYLNPLARASYNKKENKWDFEQLNNKDEKKGPSEDSKAMNIVLKQMAENNINNTYIDADADANANANAYNGVGVDIVLISELNLDNDNFVQRNFTPFEIKYCRSQPDTFSSFAGKWAAKEAVIKAVSSYSLEAKKIWEGAGAPLKEIEIIKAKSGAPKVVLSDKLSSMVKSLGVHDIKVTISHSGQFAIAVANTN